MSVDQQDSFVGQWWLPGQPSKVFVGMLDIGQGVDLQLYENVDTPSSVEGRDRFDPPILHGRSMGSCLTLLDNIQTGFSTKSSGEQDEVHRRIVVGTALVGDSHLETVGDCRFNRASFRLTNLDHWVYRTPYRWTSTPTQSIKLLKLPVLEASVPGCKIFLRRRTTSHHGYLTESGYISHEVLELHLDERHALDELEYRFIRPLEQLLTLATGTNCEALELRVGNDDAVADWQAIWPYSSYAVRRRSSDMAETGRERIRQHMRFGMNCLDFPPNVDFGDILRRWFSLQESLSSVFDLIFSLRTETAGYLQQQMFTIASAIEGLHRGLNPQLEERTEEDRARNREILAVVKSGCPDHHQWMADKIAYAHRRSYVFRLRELLQDTSHVMASIVGDEEAWTQQLRDVRDGIGHVLLSQDAKTFHQVVAMLRSAQLLAEIVLLRQLGFTDTECRRSIEHHWERENVRALVEKSFPEWFIGRE